MTVRTPVIFMPLVLISMMMGVLVAGVHASPSQAIVSRHEGRVSGYYGAVMVVTKERIDHDNATLGQLGVQHRIGKYTATHDHAIYEADASDATGHTTKTQPAPAKGITMAEFVANQIRLAAATETDAFLVASNFE